MKKLLRDFRALIYCVCELAVGVLLLIDPIAFTSAIVRIFGIVFCVFGVFNIMTYFKLDPELGSMSMGFTKGLVQAIAGVFCIFRPEWFATAFPLLAVAYGIVILIVGLIKLQWSVDMVRLGTKYWYIPGIGGITSVIFALVIMFNPFTTTTVLWIFAGLSLIAEAIIDAASTIMTNKKHRAKADTEEEYEEVSEEEAEADTDCEAEAQNI